jgi:hypothetical protein
MIRFFPSFFAGVLFHTQKSPPLMIDSPAQDTALPIKLSPPSLTTRKSTSHLKQQIDSYCNPSKLKRIILSILMQLFK